MVSRIEKERCNYYKQKGLWSEQTLLDYWNDAVQKWGGREYVADNLGKRYTYAEMDEKAEILAAWMESQGVRSKDMVTVQCVPRTEFVMIVIACLKLGAVIVPMKMRTGAEEWVRLMKQIQSKVHFCMGIYHEESLQGFINDCEKRLEFSMINVYIGEGAEDGIRFDEIMEVGGKRKLEKPTVKAEDPAVILFTSGTTMGSRGVLLSHNNIISSEKIFNRQLNLKEDDSIFMPAPLSHATGFHHGIVSPMLYGGRLVVLDQYAPEKAFQMMREERCTYSMGATPFLFDYLKLMDQGSEKPDCLKFYICGGAPVSEQIISHAWNRYQLLVCECYGSTESVPHILIPPAQAVELGGKWSGIVPEEVEVRIVDEHCQDVKSGEIGEELSRGPNVFLGYLNDEESTKQVLDAEGWYHSGDLCYSDGLGRVKICGRKKDILVRGGENLNINEIEANLLGCPGIRKAAVVGMKDERLGERICAFIVPEDGREPVTKEEVSAYLASKRISKWLWPERIEYIDELFYTDSGKIRRYLLQQELERRLKKEVGKR